MPGEKKMENWVQGGKRQKIDELDDILVVGVHILQCSYVKDITGYSFSHLRTTFVYTGFVLTCGLLRLVFHWFPHWMLMCMYNKCALMEAEKILVQVNIFSP